MQGYHGNAIGDDRARRITYDDHNFGKTVVGNWGVWGSFHILLQNGYFLHKLTKILLTRASIHTNSFQLARLSKKVVRNGKYRGSFQAYFTPKRVQNSRQIFSA